MTLSVHLVVMLLASKWNAARDEPKVFHVSHESPTFSKKFDDIQDKLHTLAARDDLLTGLQSTFIPLPLL